MWVGVGAVRFRHSHYISGLYTGGQGVRKADSTELYMPKCVSLDVFQLRISGRFFNSVSLDVFSTPDSLLIRVIPHGLLQIRFC